MSSKRKIILAICIAGILLNICILMRSSSTDLAEISLNIEMNSDKENKYQVFYTSDKEINQKSFMEEKSTAVTYDEAGVDKLISFPVLSTSRFIRFDLGDLKSNIKISSFYLKYMNRTITVDKKELQNAQKNMISSIQHLEDGSILISAENIDPYLLIDVQKLNLQEFVSNIQNNFDWIKKILVCAILDILLIGMIKFADKLMVLPVEIFKNRRLIWKLSKNDFKTKFAGSYLGIVWAFVQPVVTVLVYWFVFQVGLRSGDVGDFPFVLWLIAGLVPWFFFSEALNSGTNALMEYNYLVKKVVFKISILPIIKVLSALFVHVFFVAFTLVLYSCYGYTPDFHTLQIIYFSFCAFMLVLGISYATCAIVVFFRDLTQIISIVLQVGVWMTPIMWNIDILPSRFKLIFRLNPMYYIVNGYRDALINKVWFWDNFYSTAYFWLFTAAAFGVGALLFKRLKVHFADVL